MTIRELKKKGAEVLGGRDTAILDCEVLMCFLLDKTKEQLITDSEDEVDKFNASMFMEYVRKVGRGYPVAYVTGEKEFYGLNFFVDERVLIPRPETELIVEKALEYLNEVKSEHDKSGEKCGFRILDVGTGSGNVAVAVAKNFDCDAIDEIEAVDISEGAVEIAKINAAQYGFENLINIFQSDLLEIVENDEFYDLITANLPYIGTESNNLVDENVKKNEPMLALYGGSTGVELYKKLFQQIKDKNIGFGCLIGEFGFGQRKEVEELLNTYFEHKWIVLKDLAGIDRVFVIKN
ncbi:MAG: peptide chain release factor N(5)-glutamine methyltransferase [Candidatus Gracilibacteria bacterium]|jgi:release factor glutamine methyltransferase